jgi:exosortase C (VPDSG-CTERM-specific)
VPAAPKRAAWRDLSRPNRRRVGWFAGYVALLILLFGQPLVALLRHAMQHPLHSHIPLVPLISGYLLYTTRSPFTAAYRSSLPAAVLMALIGVAALAVGIWWLEGISTNDSLALTTTAFVSLVAAGGFLFLGSAWMFSAAFPMAFLLFLVPMPDAMTHALETASMLASADVAAWMLNVSGTPLLRDGQVFVLPGIVLEVAEECSGIRSSWVLLITSLLAAHMFLKSPWRRAVLVLFVIPLGIVRNGFRILVIGLLCVHIGPHMIDSVIHHQGGPLFFVLSLGPMFLLLWWLRRHDGRLVSR